MNTIDVARYYHAMMIEYRLCMVVDVRKGARRAYQLVNAEDESILIMRHEDAVALSELCYQPGDTRKFDTYGFIVFFPLPDLD